MNYGLKNRKPRDILEPVTSTIEKQLSRTISWAELPDWHRDNEYIVEGYRRIQNNWRGCIESVFGYWHNETVNIHSHLFGAILFFGLLLTNHSVNLTKYESVIWLDTFVFTIFMIGAVLCLSWSTVYHMVLCHSEEVADRLHSFDYTGIIVLTVGSFYPCIYYGFFCSPFLQIAYLALITVSGFGAAYVVLSPIYSKPTHRGARTKVFITLGLCSILPVSHGLINHGFNEVVHDMGFKWLFLSGYLYIQGALIYANRIPEKFFPGKFDYIFASHQIFHIHVLAAALAHYFCLLTSLDYWHGSHNGSCPI